MTRGQWKKAVLARGKCERCPATERLHAHHIDRDPTNNVIENGELLCVECHAGEHESPQLLALDEASRSQGPRTEETRRKISEGMRGNTNGAANRGRVISEDHKRNLSAALQGRVSPRKGVVVSEETRRRLREANVGKKLTEAHRAAISAGLKARKAVAA